MECHCGNDCGYIGADIELIDILEKVRKKFSKPVIVHCASRCPDHNESVGSKPTSKHIRGIAADFHIDDVCNDVIYAYLESIMNNWGSLGIYDWGIHVDVRSACAPRDRDWETYITSLHTSSI